MQFGAAISTACTTFILTNIDDLFILITFFAESSLSSSPLTPLKITLGQYIGFTIILIISMIGYGIAVVLPSEPIGFLGLLPMLLGVWGILGLAFEKFGKAGTAEYRHGGEELEEGRFKGLQTWKAIAKVSLITLLNGGDNISTYIPLFSQVHGAEIAIYIIVYYILLGIWCLIAALLMKQRHILSIAQKYAGYVIPWLYVGLGIYIVVKSGAYTWSEERIDSKRGRGMGKVVLGVCTAGVLLGAVCVMVWVMVWVRWRNRERDHVENGMVELEENGERDDRVGDGGYRARRVGTTLDASIPTT